MIAAVLGTASYCGGILMPLAVPPGVAWAQSSRPSVASLIATLSQTPVDTAALASKLGKVDAATITSLMLTAASQNKGAAGGFTGAVANALAAAVAKTPSLAATVGTGMGKAAAQLTAAGFGAAATTISTSVATGNATLLSTFQSANSTPVNPNQVQATVACVNSGSCN